MVYISSNAIKGGKGLPILLLDPCHKSINSQFRRQKQIDHALSPLSTTAIEALRAQVQITQNVLLIKATPLFSLRADSLTGAFLRLCRRVGIAGFDFHNLRREATSRFFEKGLNPVEVATITGHKDTKMLMRYTHLRAEDLVGRFG